MRARDLVMLMAASIGPEVLPGQARNQVVSVGVASAVNSPPDFPVAAAGSVLTIFTSDLGVPDAVAAGTPLPRALAGVRVLARGYPEPLPILRVHTFRGPSPVDCLVADNRCSHTEITVQIPTERVCVVPGGIPGTCDDSHPPLAVLNVEANGRTGPDFPVRVTTSWARLLNSCDSIFGPPPPPTFPFQGCGTLATHADGSLIDNAHPAGLGEVITLYAVGFPWDTPTGEAVREAQPLKSAFLPLASFNFRMLMMDPGFGVQEIVRKETLWRVEYVGAVAGHVGLFQVNLQIPPPTLTDLAPLKLARSCESGANLSITLSNPGTNSAAICVQ